MDYKSYIAEKLNVEGVSKEELTSLIVTPPDNSMGDFALPCFRFAKVLRKAPAIIAEELASNYQTDSVIVKVTAVNGYLNFTVNRQGKASAVLKEILSLGENYGSSELGKGKTICIDYSSINVAKPFHIGHLSTTVIGGALYRIYKKLGYNVVGINHLGDYGTQFGKLIYAYKAWGDKEAVEKGRVKELMRLYVKYHDEAEKNPELDDKAREYFKLIEQGDKECNELFKWFKELTLMDVDKVYKQLGITFDSYNGESFFNDKMGVVIDELQEKGLLVESDGAKIVDLEEYGMPPCLILRSDGASLYATRDLAAAYYRKKEYDFDKCLYVVAYQQNLHFKQFFKVLELLGKPWAKDMVHVAFGMVSLEEGTMSTRKGKVVFLEDVINKCCEKALSVIDEKNPDLENKEETAKAVGVGAVIFGALSSSRIKDIVFSYDKVLNFDGETGPYCQYTYARALSVLRKGGEIGKYSENYELNDQEYDLLSLLANYPEIVKQSAEKYEPSLITRFAVDVSEAFNKFYFDCKILGEEEEVKNFRLALTFATKTVIKNALSLLGIKAPEKM
ncbi:MAG: arginine--tRNA ligase [Clostridia bacterium]|nr:arginine--tRNA ligase [Clostridia bacterium]